LAHGVPRPGRSFDIALHGEGLERENSTFTVSTLTGAVAFRG
jgi:hypothetical protein